MKSLTLLASTFLFLTVKVSFGTTVIYSDDFSGLAADNLRGTAPDVGGGAWLGTNNFKANGGVTAGAGSVTLPFSPVAGNIYELSADLTFTTNDASWIGVGFADASATWTGLPAVGNGNRFTGSVITGYSWMITAPTAGQSGFRGNGGTNAAVENPGVEVLSSTVLLTITLDTTGANWQTSYFVNSALLGTTTAVGTQPIDAVGFSVFNGALGSVDNFLLTSIPEPSAALLSAAGLLGWLRRRRA
jgi:MprA protease rhombosortase-interaction domain-containing protein